MPLVLNGQSVSHIFANHSEEIEFSRRTIFNYIDKCVFDVRNIDLPRRVRYKKRKTKPSKPAQYVYRQWRTYEDFKAFTESHPELDVVEMDTVKRRREKGKCLLTMIFAKYDFMLIIIVVLLRTITILFFSSHEAVGVVPEASAVNVFFLMKICSFLQFIIM